MKGIYVVDDIIKNDSKLISSIDLNRKFGINLNILNYYTMRAKLEPPALCHSTSAKAHLSVSFGCAI